MLFQNVQHQRCTFVVLFSSAGVGRTGTLISLDYLLEQAAEEGVVDIFRCVYQMRKNRVNMIQTLVSEGHLYKIE